ncbi:hypothetical protein [Leptodesmis sichuanensis]|uniref:hypothetical protein n=1 Tax=Leptodesmis sichuanensis TaxID=2906798 RepID=UPI001F43CE01|nr:hypothetical protein [Leptodesmis sichuanensis]UIE38043.1 hypothetical protein KIK02_24605 [Leptodesmis sichuanensis A121]
MVVLLWSYEGLSVSGQPSAIAGLLMLRSGVGTNRGRGRSTNRNQVCLMIHKLEVREGQF